MTSPFVKLASLYARSPSANALDLALDRVAAAERNLAEARSAARVVARRGGASLENLFGKCAFIARSTGERWLAEGIERGHAERDAVFLAVARSVTHPDSRYVAIGRAMQEAMQRGAFNGILGETTNDPDALEAEAEAEAAAKAKVVADAIIKAAARARTTGENERPPPTGRAKKILDAARKAHPDRR